MPDLTYIGGVMELYKTAAMAEVYHIPVAPHNMYGSIATMAAGQICAFLPNFTILERQWADVQWGEFHIGEPIQAENGYIEVSDKPSIGGRD